MVKRLLIVKIISVFVLCTAYQLSFAESAPVYDADALDQPLDSTEQDLPPPPAPFQEAQNDQSPNVPAQVQGQGGPQQPDDVFMPYQPPPEAQKQEAEVDPNYRSNNNQQELAQGDPNEASDEPPAPVQGNMMTSENQSDARINRLERELTTLRKNSSPDATQIESLRNEIQKLHAEVDELHNQVAQLQNQQKELLTDINKRIAAPKGATPQLASDNANGKTLAVSDMPIQNENPPKANGQPDVAQEQQIYQEAYNLIKAKKYNDAVTILQTMLQKYPSGQFASNAHYWLGELFGLMGKNDKALSEFNTVVDNYPESPRVSDAMLKVGLIFAAEAKWIDAKAIFRRVINHYPGTASSRLAKEQLKQIRQAGH